MMTLANILTGIAYFFLYAVTTVVGLIVVAVLLFLLVNFSLIIVPIAIIAILIYAAVKKVQNDDVD